MPRAKKTQDPKLVDLLDRADKQRQVFERLWARIVRTFNAAAKARKRVAYYQRLADKRREEVEGATQPDRR